MVGVGGFEPPTSRSRTVRSSLAELHPVSDRMVNVIKAARRTSRETAVAAVRRRTLH